MYVGTRLLNRGSSGIGVINAKARRGAVMIFCNVTNMLVMSKDSVEDCFLSMDTSSLELTT